MPGKMMRRFEPSLNPASAAIVVCDEDPTASLIQRSGIARDVIGGITELDPENETGG
jgi:hypothetical protein